MGGSAAAVGGGGLGHLGVGPALELRVGVGEDEGVLPALGVGSGDPVLVLAGAAAHDVAFDVQGQAGGLEAVGLELDLVGPSSPEPCERQTTVRDLTA
jgi:hypothetical protein